MRILLIITIISKGILLLLLLLSCCTQKKENQKDAFNDSVKLKIGSPNTDKSFQKSKLQTAKQNLDSSRIKHYLIQLNKREQEDNDRCSYSSGQVHYSPDSLFKIFVLRGECCGSYCNPLYYSSIHWQVGGQKYEKEVSLTEIDSIYKLGEANEISKYLILQKTYGRNGSTTYTGFDAAIISIAADSVIFHPFAKGNLRENSTTLSISQRNGYEEDPKLKYNPQLKQLTYQYSYNYMNCCEVDTDSLIEGTYVFLGSEFELINESKKETHPY